MIPKVLLRWRHMLMFWVGLVLTVFVSSATFAYDCQTQARATYDHTNKQALRYDTAVVLAANENLNQLTGGRVFFTTFPQFLAEKGVGSHY